MFLKCFPTILRSFEAKVFDIFVLFLQYVQETFFWPVQKPLFHVFCRKLLLQMAVEWWEIILKTYSGYEKHSSKSGQYVSKKIRVIRRVEMKILQEMDENVANRA